MEKFHSKLVYVGLAQARPNYVLGNKMQPTPFRPKLVRSAIHLDLQTFNNVAAGGSTATGKLQYTASQTKP